MLVNPKGEPVKEDLAVPELTNKQRREATERTSVSAVVVHEAIRHDGEEELRRPLSALGWSGLAAGLAMGFSFLTEGLLRSALPDRAWTPLIVNLGYPIGFLIVIIGRQQLFTENTLTAIIPLLARRNMTTFRAVLRLWGAVLTANLVGAHLFAWVIAQTPVARPEVMDALKQLAVQAAAQSAWVAIIRGVFAGWLIAMVVWMLAAVDRERVAIIVALTYVVGLGGLTHVIAGSIEVLFLVMIGAKTWSSYFFGYMCPTLLGNILGGVSLVSALNHAQVVAGMDPNRKAAAEKTLS